MLSEHLNDDATDRLTSSVNSSNDPRNSWRNVSRLVMFNMKVSLKRKKPRQVFVPIIGNLLIINLIAIVIHNQDIPSLRNMTELNPLSSCVFHDEPMAFYCDETRLSADKCDSSFDRFSDKVKDARLSVLRYDNPISYRSAIIDSEYKMGVQLLSIDHIDIEVLSDDFDSMFYSLKESDCRIFNAPDCVPVRSVHSCSLAIEVSALSALSPEPNSPQTVRLFPMPAKTVNGFLNFLWIIPFYLSVLFLNVFNFALIELVLEKKNRQVDYLFSWGFDHRDHFLAWIFSNCLYGLGVIAFLLAGLQHVIAIEYMASFVFGSLMYFVSLMALAYGLASRIESPESASRVASLADMVLNVSAIGVSTIHATFWSFFFALIPTIPFFLMIRSILLHESTIVPLFMGLVSCVVLIKLGSFKREKFEKIPDFFQIEGFSFRYPKSTNNVLNNVSIDIRLGETVGLVAKNGGGKTTLITALLNGKKNTAFCFQEDCFWESLTVRDHLNFFAFQLVEADKGRVDELLVLLALVECLDQQSSSLSGGQKRRLSFLLAFVRAEFDPRVSAIVLDEATSGVDTQGRRIMWNLIGSKKRDLSVLFTTHYLDEAAVLADRVCFLANGSVVAMGTVMELSAQFGGGLVCEGSFDDQTMSSLDGIKGLTVKKLSGDKIRIMGPVQEGLSILEKACGNLIVESVSLDNLFNDIVRSEPNENPSAEDGVCETKNSQIYAVARVRVLPFISSFGSIFTKILFPIMLVVGSASFHSFDTVDVETFFLKTPIPKAVAVKGPNPFPPSTQVTTVPANMSMWQFLIDESSQQFDFALENESVLWVPPEGDLLGIFQIFFSPIKISFSTFQSQPVYVEHLISAVRTFTMYVVFALIMISTQCGANLFDEKTVKKLAIIQGLRPSAYWLGSLAGHLVVHLPIVGSAVVMTIVIWGRAVTDVPHSIQCLLIAGILCLTQLVLFGYLSIFLFAKKETMLKFNSLVSVLLFEGLVLLLIGAIFHIENFSGSLLFFGGFFAPPFTLAGTIAAIVRQHTLCCSFVTEQCDWSVGPSVLSSCVWIFLGGISQIFCIIMLLIFSEKKRLHPVNWAVGNTTERESSVVTETERIMNGTSDDVVFVKLWHMYEKKWVVKDLTFGVQPGEVLALLGSNGAGKTTALSVLLGTVDPVAGFARIWPGRTVGYCPQESALWPQLNALEHISFYSRVRGVGSAKSVLFAVGIEPEDQLKMTKTYSGGMKRRLCIAIALIGAPSVLVLDEPTAGVDVGGKREIWDLLKKLCLPHVSVLLTTHSMEEADQLATRISIMDKGSLVKIGSANDWKHEEKTVRITVQSEQTLEKRDIEQVFEKCVWRGDNEFELDMTFMRYSELYKEMSKLVQNKIISDFAIRQLSLDDLFLKTVSG